MALASWPDGVRYRPQNDGFQPYAPWLDPISTDMEGGNTRSRPRPGDNVGTITQTIEMPNTELATLMDFIKNTLNNGTARFNMTVFINGAYVTKVVKFHEKAPTPQPIKGSRSSTITMTLRVFGV